MRQVGQGQQDRARLFDGEAERYDRTRPGYPEALIDDVLGPMEAVSEPLTSNEPEALAPREEVLVDAENGRTSQRVFL